MGEWICEHLLWIIGVGFGLFLVVFVICACILSSRISRGEELRAKLKDTGE